MSATAITPAGQKFVHLNANGTTVVQAGAGVLQGININTKGASANTLTLYDNTAASGTVIAVIDTTGGTAALRFDVKFATGLTAVLATGTAADITVSYH
jgi:hypothetical protein